MKFSLQSNLTIGRCLLKSMKFSLESNLTIGRCSLICRRKRTGALRAFRRVSTLCRCLSLSTKTMSHRNRIESLRAMGGARARRRDHRAAKPLAAPTHDQLTLLDRRGCAMPRFIHTNLPPRLTLSSMFRLNYLVGLSDRVVIGLSQPLNAKAVIGVVLRSDT